MPSRTHEEYPILSDVIEHCDLALLDGTFYSRDEVPRQDEILHPPILETLDLLSPEEAAKGLPTN